MPRINIFMLYLALVLSAGKSPASAQGQKHVLDAGINDFRSDRYLLVRKGTNGKKDSVTVYMTKADKEGPQREWGAQKGKNFHFAGLTLHPNQPIEIEVYKINSKASNAQVRPSRLGYKKSPTAVIRNNAMVSIKISRASKLSVEFADDPDHIDPLILAVNEEEKPDLVPDKKALSVLVVSDSSSLKNIPVGKKIVYFEPGLVTIGHWNVPRHVTQIYLSENAVVRGYIECNRNGNSPPVTINGRGILTSKGWPYHYPSTKNIDAYEHNSNWYKSIFIYGGRGHLIEGITIIDPTSFTILLNASDSKISNVNINGFRFNNDGITVMGKNITVQNCFVRVNDDAVVPNIQDSLVVENCVFWQLQAGSIFQFGWTPHSMRNIKIRDCDVLHAEWLATNENSGFINAMGMMKNDKNVLVENISVSNIYFDTPVTRFLDVRPSRQSKRNEPQIGKGQPWIYKNCSFSNIHFNQGFDKSKSMVYFFGFSDQFASDGFKFSEFYFQGKKLSVNDLNQFINIKNVQGLKIN